MKPPPKEITGMPKKKYNTFPNLHLSQFPFLQPFYVKKKPNSSDDTLWPAFPPPLRRPNTKQHSVFFFQRRQLQTTQRFHPSICLVWPKSIKAMEPSGLTGTGSRFMAPINPEPPRWFPLCNTVDGRNPAPSGMYKCIKTLAIMGNSPHINRVQDFFHRQKRP